MFLGCLVAGLPDYWVVVCWGCWVVGFLDCCVVVLLGCCVVVLLGCWVVGLLDCWGTADAVEHQGGTKKGSWRLMWRPHVVEQRML